MLWRKFSAWLWVYWLGFGDLFACVCLVGWLDWFVLVCLAISGFCGFGFAVLVVRIALCWLVWLRALVCATLFIGVVAGGFPGLVAL